MGDTPNEKMSRVRNLIRFPATGKDRRIRLEESRDPRIRFVTKLRFVCGWLLAFGALHAIGLNRGRQTAPNSLFTRLGIFRRRYLNKQRSLRIGSYG